jgi:4-hydroxy-4-methyl-2-oxoglutarate aldolase
VPALVPPVSAVADVLALFGLDGWLTPPLTPVVAAGEPVCGTAVTLRLAAGPEGAGLGAMHAAVSHPLSGAVLVLAGAGDVPGAVWGEIMSRAALRQGAVAVLVDGAVRDQGAMAAEGLPVYAVAERVVGPAGRGHVVDEGVPVEVGGVRVEPGDVIVVDGSGAVRIPAAHADRVLAAATHYADGEERVKEALSDGESLLEAYRHKRNAAETIRRALHD